MTKLQTRRMAESDSLTKRHGVGHQYPEREDSCARCRKLPLFCCDVSLVDLHESSVVSRTHSVAGMALGSTNFWRNFRCPRCSRVWIDSHDHHTGSGYDCEWMPQRMMFLGEPNHETPPRDGLIRPLYERPQPYRVEDTEYGCQIPREAGT